MTHYLISIRRSLLSMGVALVSLTSPLQADLGQALKEVDWEGMIGTWVDAETKGERFKTTYAWKFEGKLIEVTSKMGQTQNVSLMGMNSENEDVVMSGGNSKGGIHHGKWSMDGKDAILEVEYVKENGESGAMKIRYHQVSEDEIKMTLTPPDGGDTYEFNIVRLKK
ncbi:MAG: hypothetical protein ACON38_00840 [Akkermansiaceae bacterium]